VPFRYTTTQHGGYGGAEMGQVRNGKIVLFGGPLTTDPTKGSAITPYTTQQPAPPANGIPSN
jgi:branched-chain amino acid transport system substrate-binding protein